MLVETIHEIKCRPRRTVFLLAETIFLDFCRYSCEWKQLFPASGHGVFIKSSRLVYMDFALISNRVLLFRAFFSAAGKHYRN